MINKIAITLISFIILLTLTACITNDTGSSSTNLNFNTPSTSQVTSDMPKNISPESNEKYLYFRNTNLFSKDSIVTQDGLSFGKIRINKTKLLPDDIRKEDIIYFDDRNKIDEYGTLITPTTYLFVTMDIYNNTDKEITFSWNSASLCLLDNDNKVQNKEIDNSSWEACYRSGGESNHTKEYFLQTIQPGETITGTVGYIVEDEWVNSQQLYFYFKPPNLQTKYFENMKAFKVNE